MSFDSAPINLTHHFLIAMPGLEDESFSRSVVYLCEHSERGALGLIINKPSDITLKGLFDKVDLSLRREDLTQEPVFQGGPVQTERGFVLHDPMRGTPQGASTPDADEDDSPYASTMSIPGGLEMTTSKDVLEALSHGAGPRRPFLRQDVGKHVFGHHHVEPSWVQDKLHRRVVHQQVVQRHVREVPGHLHDDPPPQLRVFDHFRLIPQQRAREGAPALPQLLVGISEGAELLPALAPEVPQLAGLVVLASSGLDPQEAGALQAQRLGAQADWEELGRMVAGRRPDSAVAQGRSLSYWRDLWNWSLTLPLVRSPWPLLQVWGGDDALVPLAAYERFAELASLRTVPYCARRLDGANHGLQRGAGPLTDGVQLVWAWIEQWARNPASGLCAPLLDRPLMLLPSVGVP